MILNSVVHSRCQIVDPSGRLFNHWFPWEYSMGFQKDGFAFMCYIKSVDSFIH